MAKECKICGAWYQRTRREALGLCPTCIFWALVDKTSSPHGCWLWTGQVRNGHRCGYGEFRLKTPNGSTERATHRISWVITNGDIPDGLCVLHNCDGLYPVNDITNRRCVNPEHLRLGTQLDNIADSVARGRIASGARHGAHTHPEKLSRGSAHGNSTHPDKRPRGDKHVCSKLSDSLVSEIRSSAETGRALAKRLGVAFQTISKVRRGQSWCHVV